jgi:hypothetical protein
MTTVNIKEENDPGRSTSLHLNSHYGTADPQQSPSLRIRFDQSESESSHADQWDEQFRHAVQR